MGDQKPCHNCRKRRLRCDRSVPACYKCTRTGQRCLGYGRLYRWVHSEIPAGPRNQNPNSALIAFSEPSSSPLQPTAYAKSPRRDSTVHGIGRDLHVPLNYFPADPLLQDLSTSSRQYFFYFASRFCQDLVVHDSFDLGTNPFRGLIPISRSYPYLQHIIIAVSAIHYYRNIKISTSEIPGCSEIAQNVLVDALRARQDAIRETIALIKQRQADNYHIESQEEQEALLATVLFFVNFTLIDSGRDGWQNHLGVAESLLSIHGDSPASLLLRAGNNEPPYCHPSESTTDFAILSAPGTTPKSSGVTCRPLTACDYVTSDIVAYSIWNCALNSLVSSSSQPPARGLDYAAQSLNWDVAEVSRILSRTENNSYHSCPAYLMGLMLQTARIAQAIKASGNRSPDAAQIVAYAGLLKYAQNFDVKQWAAGVSTHIIGLLGAVNEQERRLRCHIAATYRAAVCLYILLVAPGLSAEVKRCAELNTQDTMSLPALQTTEELASTIFAELSFIPKTNPLFKYTVWPVFLTGVDTVSDTHREWVIERLRAMRDVCPWGMITSAMDTLAKIWKLRDGDARNLLVKQTKVHHAEEDRSDWLARLQGLRIDCLIV
ncbi:fungal-specific transcription factor domain-containing protein [Xylaria nigripes]|nr:fungal-specific transcription factor domain-containing protein [Xylaria nigripes]